MFDINADSVNVLIAERMNTSIEIRRPGLVNDGNEIIEWSERDGWAHFYLYDKNGKLKNQITSGAWHCENIINIDEKKRVLYFTANAKEKNENPYYLHLYKINFDGTGLKLLNDGDFDHQDIQALTWSLTEMVSVTSYPSSRGPIGATIAK
jgi:dipeptidyl-peptidase-4